MIEAYAADLAGYRLTKGSIGFQPDQGLPDDLVERLVQARSAEVAPG